MKLVFDEIKSLWPILILLKCDIVVLYMSVKIVWFQRDIIYIHGWKWMIITIDLTTACSPHCISCVFTRHLPCWSQRQNGNSSLSTQRMQFNGHESTETCKIPKPPSLSNGLFESVIPQFFLSPSPY